MRLEYVTLEVDKPSVKISRVTRSGVVHLSFTNTMIVPTIAQEPTRRLSTEEQEQTKIIDILKLKSMIGLEVAHN